MRIAKLYSLVAPIVAVVLASSACQTAQRPIALLPAAQATAPAITTAPAPTPAAPVAGVKSVPAATPAVQAEPKPDPIAELVSKAEAEYQEGLENHKAGNLDAAKRNFDHAFDLLRSSPVAVHSDERLQKEFDRLVEGINGLEQQAPQTAENSDEQKPEPAPIDEANELTYPVDPNIKAQAEAEVKATHSDLPLMMTDQVAGYINYFSTRGRGTLERALIRSGRYRDMILKTLKQEGVPQDLIYLAQAESGFHPTALSRAGARGMWQFMGSRARAYGLERSFYVDDRQDPEKATRAAARHLKDLYNQFGDWYLAMAAYNSGPGTVQHAVKRTGYADFWQLYQRNVLPKETRNYVPIIVAVTIMAKNPAQYGLDSLTPDKPLPYDTVKIDYPVDLRLVAECVDVPPADLQELNPSLLRLTTPKDGDFVLHIPVGTKEKYLTAIAAIPEDMRVWWRYHYVVPGDTLASIARNNHTTARAILEANHLDSETDVEAGGQLVVPVAPGKHAAGEEAAYARGITRYKVHKGDTVIKVADVFGVSPAMIRRWNHLKGDGLQGRRVLYVHLPVTPSVTTPRPAVASKSNSKSKLQPVSKSTPVQHKVQRGETLYSIASTHHTTVAALKRDNGDLAILRPGMILLIRNSQ